MNPTRALLDDARRLVAVFVIATSVLLWPAHSSAAETASPTWSADPVSDSRTFPVVGTDGSAMGSVVLEGSVTATTATTSLTSGELTLPAGWIRIQSCLGIYPSASDTPARCRAKVIAINAPRLAAGESVQLEVSRPAGAAIVNLGFVRIDRWTGSSWQLMGSSWPPSSAPSITLGAETNWRRAFDDAPAPIRVPAERPAGMYLLTAVVKNETGRVQLQVNGERVGEFGKSDVERTISAPVWLDGPESTVGVWGNDARVTELRLTPESPEFTTRGSTILGPDGVPVTPLGVNRTGLNQSVDPERLDADDFAAMAAAGVNTVRLKLGEHLWVDGHCAVDPDYPTAVDRAVGHITELGMVALLDLAWTTGPTDCGTPGLQMMPDETTVEFWSEVAARYADNALVAFGLYNEPYGVSPQVWRDGGTIVVDHGSGTTDWDVVGMQELYDTVRATGADNLVYVSGHSWAHDLRSALWYPLDGHGIVYSAHIYNHSGDTLPSLVEAGIEPMLGKHPVVITEFGTTSSHAFNARVIAWAAEHGVGWQAFMWAPKAAGAYGLFDDWGSYVPRNGGWPVFAALAAARDAP